MKLEIVNEPEETAVPEPVVQLRLKRYENMVSLEVREPKSAWHQIANFGTSSIAEFDYWGHAKRFFSIITFRGKEKL
jgi:hypothetical protein